jgi:multidrug efflux pump
VLRKAQDSGKFWFVDSDLKIDKPQSTVVVDRDLISTLGLTQQDVGGALGAALGGGYVNYFSIAGRSYKVIPQVLQADRLNPDQVLDYYVRAPNGAVIPASTVARRCSSSATRSRKSRPAATRWISAGSRGSSYRSPAVSA